MAQSESRLGQVNRRSLLIGLGGWTIAHMLGGCAGQPTANLRVHLLRGTVPAQLFNQFQKSIKGSSAEASLTFEAEPQLQTLFTALQTWKRNAENPPEAPVVLIPEWVPLIGQRNPHLVPDLITLGDYWLSTAIQQGLLQPLDVQTLKLWGQLSPQLKALVTRNQAGQPDPQGQIWGIPYLLGTTVIAYRKDILKQRGLTPPTDWSDLWRPDLQGRISLLDQSREVIGLTLKKLGQSYNTKDLATVPTLLQELRLLQENVKFYSSNAYLQPLMLGDTWVAVGWSTDLLPLAQRGQQVEVVVPRSGTALWANLWVRPGESRRELLPAAAAWMDFCSQPAIAAQFSLSTRATAPALLQMPPTDLPKNLQQNSPLLPPQAVVAASEFLEPLPDSTRRQYEQVWSTLRQG